MSVIVRDAVWHAVLRELDPYPNRPDLLPVIQPGLRPMGYSEYPSALVQAVVDYLTEDLGCDHQVGICMCDTIWLVQELLLNLQDRETCQGCHGEGFTFDREKYDRAVANDPEWGASECEGYVDCVHCDHNGFVSAGHDYDSVVGVSEA